MRRDATDPGRALLARDPDIRRHVRRSTIAAVPLALLVAAQAFGLAAMVVALAQHGRFDSQAAAAFVVAAAARGALSWWLERAGRRAAAAAIGRLRAQVVADASLLSAAQPGTLRPGEVVADAVTQLPAIEQYVGRFLAGGPIAGATTLIVLLAVASTDLLSAALLAPTVPLLGLFMWLVGVEAGAVAERRLASLQLLGAHLLDVLRGLVDLRAHGRAAFQRSQVRAAARAYRRETMATLRSAFVSGLVLELIAMLGTALVAVFGGVRLAEGGGTLAAILPALILAPELYAPIRRLGAGYHDAADARAALSRLAAVRAAAADARTPGMTDGPPSPLAGTSDLTLAGLTVAGAPGRPARLAGLTATLPAGSTTALAGPSGAGKSTLTAVLLGLLAPTDGCVRSGGVDLSSVDLARWRRSAAWVPQDPTLIAGTLADNVRLAAPTASEDQVRAALTEAGLGTLLAELPEGLSTPLGEGGAQLSSGELRRLALARALVTDATLLVLDEPTAQLDELTAARLLETLDRVRRGRTTVLITHDPLAMRHADQVLHLEGGELVHSEVLRRLSAASVAVPPAAGQAPAPAPLPELRLAPAPRRPTLRTALRMIAPERHSRVATEIRRAVALGGLSAIAAVAVLTLSGGLIVQAATQPPVLALTVVIVTVRMFSILRAVTRYGERLMSHDAALRILEQVRVRIFTHISRHVPGRWSDRSSEALDRAVGDVDRAADLLIRVLVPGAAAVMAGAVTTLVAAIVSIPAGLLVGAATLAMGLTLSRVGLSAGAALADAEPARTALAQQLLTALDASRELQLSGRTAVVVEQIAARGRALDRAAARHGSRTAALGGLTGAGAAGAATAMAALLAPVVAQDTLGAPYSGPLAAALVLGTMAVIERLEGLAEAGLATPAATAAVGRLAPALLEVDEDDGAGQADRCLTWLGGRPTLRAEGIALQRGGRPVLREVSISVEPGEVVALTGESGSGKSTLLLVLAGLLTPEAGEVHLATTRLSRLSDAARSGRVLLVPSAPHLFGGTLAANLRLAAPEAADPELVAALRAVGLGDWFAELPDGLDSLLGEGGAMLSGGQRQRIGLARAVLAPAPLVLLDEPASHLPEADAEAALRAVLTAQPGRGGIVVSHRGVERSLARREIRLSRRMAPASASAEAVHSA